ncbi:ribonuclease HI [Pseudoramibacter alactolyticus]
MIRVSLSETAKKIMPKLREYYDNDDYVQGVILNAHGDKNLETISAFIDYAEENEENINSDDIAALAFVLGKKNHNNET